MEGREAEFLSDDGMFKDSSGSPLQDFTDHLGSNPNSLIVPDPFLSLGRDDGLDYLGDLPLPSLSLDLDEFHTTDLVANPNSLIPGVHVPSLVREGGGDYVDGEAGAGMMHLIEQIDKCYRQSSDADPDNCTGILQILRMILPCSWSLLLEDTFYLRKGATKRQRLEPLYSLAPSDVQDDDNLARDDDSPRRGRKPQGLRYHLCPYCPKSFVSQSARNRHRRDKHDVQPSASAASLEVQSSPECRAKCDDTTSSQSSGSAVTI
jgi:hypothetical protein